MKKRLLSVLLILALALSLLPAVALAGNDLTGFTDAASISSDALPAMQWAVAQAIPRNPISPLQGLHQKQQKNRKTCPCTTHMPFPRDL